MVRGGGGGEARGAGAVGMSAVGTGAVGADAAGGLAGGADDGRPLGRPVPTDVRSLLVRADAELRAAYAADDAATRFVHAHLAALRSAAAVVALRGRPTGRRSRGSVWELVERVEPALSGWSSYFAGGAHLRAAVDAGRFDAVDEQRAAELVRCAEDFRDEVGMLVDPHAGFGMRSGAADGRRRAG